MDKTIGDRPDTKAGGQIADRELLEKLQAIDRLPEAEKATVKAVRPRLLHSQGAIPEARSRREGGSRSRLIVAKKPARAHHYLPQFYLAGFTLSGHRGDTLWVHDREQNKSWQTKRGVHRSPVR